MLLQTAAAIAAGALTCACLYGWGSLLSRKADAAIVYGLALYLAACGCIELLGVAHPWIFASFAVAAGCILLRRSWLCAAHRPASPAFAAGAWGFGACGLLFVALLLAVACHFDPNPWDDLGAYWLFPKRLLAEGRLHGDPFNLRLGENGLGGGVYVQALFAWLTPTSCLLLCDVAVGVGILLAMLHTAHKQSRRVPWLSCALLTPLVVLTPLSNSTPLLSGVALTAFVWRRLFDPCPGHKSAVKLGLVLSALCALKANFAVSAAALGLLLCTCAPARARQAMRTACAAVAFLMPWFITSYLCSETPFYPLLGKGIVHTQALAGLVGWPMFAINLWAIKTRLGAFAALGVWLYLRHPQTRRFVLASLFVMALFVSLGAMVFSMDCARYLYPLYAGGLFAFAQLVDANTHVQMPTTFRRGAFRLQAIAAFAAIALLSVRLTRLPPGDAEAPAGVSDDAIRDAQLHLPEHSTALVRVGRPYLFDYARNQLFVADWPGAAYPGALLRGVDDAVSLRLVLRSQGLQYLVWAYKDQGGIAPIVAQWKQSASPWLHDLATTSDRYHAMFETLRGGTGVVYDNGAVCVIDLDA